jgi:AraC-like DNA-binding protein/tetratricopeptide (TPR) repeat protein
MNLRRTAASRNPLRAPIIHFAPQFRRMILDRSRAMVREPLPRGLKQAIEWLEAEPARPWRLRDLAAVSGIAPRTLQKHFHRFLGRAPLAFLRELRFDRAREQLLHPAEHVSVTELATRCGFSHLGRFAVEYQRRYGESPSATLRRSRRVSARSTALLPFLAGALERPAVSILPFETGGARPDRAAALADEIALAVWRLRWLNVAAPTHARYHLRGKLREDPRGRIRVTVRLADALTGRYVWAAAWDGDGRDPIEFEERVALGVSRAIQPAVRAAEVERASRRDRDDLTAWELTMRALPGVTKVEAAAEGMALELLDEAMERAPHDPLPIATAAWCRGLRAGHHFTLRPELEKAKALELAVRAARLNAGDALAETMLAAGYTLAHDLTSAAVHAERALALDGGSAWAWGRSGWVKAYCGRTGEALEEFQIARSLAPADPLNFLWAVGMASTKFQSGRYDESIRWYRRAQAENPASTWTNRFLAATYVLAGRTDDGRRALATFSRAFPGVTIAEVRASLPWNAFYLDRTSEGLEKAGMPP